MQLTKSMLTTTLKEKDDVIVNGKKAKIEIDGYKVTFTYKNGYKSYIDCSRLSPEYFDIDIRIVS